MEIDVDLMKKQKVDLIKLVTNEKKLHYNNLHEKIKEIDKLKRELLKTTGKLHYSSSSPPYIYSILPK